MEGTPLLSVVVLQHGQDHLTRDCVASLRRTTTRPLELVIVDNGSRPAARDRVRDLADRFVALESNTGFAQGMNAGLAVATGEHVVFANNDTTFPEAWDVLTIPHLQDPTVGAVYPAVTAAGVRRTVRRQPGEAAERLAPFERPPSAVVVALRSTVAQELGGFSTRYGLASGEDADLAFSLWLNDLELVLEARVLVSHLGKGTTLHALPDWRTQWHESGIAFLERWAGPADDLPRLAACSQARWDRNRRAARAAAATMLELELCRDRFRPAVLRRAAGRVVDMGRRRSRGSGR